MEERRQKVAAILPAFNLIILALESPRECANTRQFFASLAIPLCSAASWRASSAAFWRLLERESQWLNDWTLPGYFVGVVGEFRSYNGASSPCSFASASYLAALASKDWAMRSWSALVSALEIRFLSSALLKGLSVAAAETETTEANANTTAKTAVLTVRVLRCLRISYSSFQMLVLGDASGHNVVLVRVLRLTRCTLPAVCSDWSLTNCKPGLLLPCTRELSGRAGDGLRDLTHDPA